MKEYNLEGFERGLAELGIALSEEQKTQFLQYYALLSRRFPKKAPEKLQAFRKNVRHRRQHRKKRCRFISAVRSLPPVSTRCRAEAA